MFFFLRRSSPSETASPVTEHGLVEKLLAAAGNGLSIQAEKAGHELVAAMAETHGFESGEEPAWLFVEQGMEPQDGGFEFMGRAWESIGANGERDGLRTLSGQSLAAAVGRVDGGIEELAVDFDAAEPLLLYQMAQGFVNLGV